MSSEDIDFATSQIFLASLLGDEKLNTYENPLQKIKELCEETKKVVQDYQQGIPSELPIKINPDVALDIFGAVAGKKWVVNQPKKSLSNKNKRIEIIIHRYNPMDDEYEKYLYKELLGAPISFIDELEELSNKDLSKRLDEWSSYELENLFDRVAQSSPLSKSSPEKKILSKKSPKKRETHGSVEKEKLEKFTEEHHDMVRNDKKLEKFRKIWANKFIKLYRKYGLPPSYKGDKLFLTKDYYYKKMLPFIIFVSFHEHVNPRKEKRAYENYYNSDLRYFTQ